MNFLRKTLLLAQNTLFCPSFFFSSIAGIAFSISFAQDLELRFKHLTIDEGLSQNIVNCIHQDSRGFMWFGTNKGLNKYDGYEFTVFDVNSGDDQALSDDYIRCLIEDEAGNLWIGTGDGGINIYDRSLNKFIELKDDTAYNFTSDINDVQSLLEDSKKNIWFLANYTVYKINTREKTIRSFDSKFFDKGGFLDYSLNVIIEDSDNKFWIGSNGGGLLSFDLDSNTVEYFKHNSEDENSISDNTIISLHEGTDGLLWIGTYNGGLNLYDRENNIFRKFIPNELVRESYTIKSIVDDKNGNLWIGTRNGLYIFDKTNHTFKQSAHDANNPNSISQNNVQAIYRDTNGNFWLGTKRGINFLNIGNLQFHHYRAVQANKEYLNHSFVTAIYEDNLDNIWFGTAESGLNVLNKKTGVFRYYTNNPNDVYSISSNNVNAITEDENSNLWIGTFQGGLNFFDRNTKRFFCYKHIPDQALIYQSPINCLLLDGDSKLWVGTSKGVMIFNREEKVFEDFSLVNVGSDVSVHSIIEDNEHNIWIGSASSMIFKIRRGLAYQENYKLPSGSESTRITSIVNEGDDLWIGTVGSGLFVFNKKTESFQSLSIKEGLAADGVRGLLIDKEKNIWAGTLKGLSKYNMKKKKFTNYYKENGLQNNQFTRGYFKSRNGQFFLGNIDGAISFYPEKINEEFSIPNVTLTEFKVLNKPVPIGGEDPILASHVSESSEIRLSHDHSSFTFTFSALDYAMSDKIQYAYMMEGFEEQWNYVGNRRYATYTNLNPGKYKFKVKAANNAHQWNEEETSIDISISPPYWDTLWFKLIIASIGLLGCLHFINHQKQKRNLLKATALANLTQLKLLRNQMNPHFLLNAFSAIRALVLIDKDRAWEMISKLSEYFRYILLNYKREKDTLNEELDAAKNYIVIQKNCFHDSLDVTYDIEDSARELIVPAFIFQPLIENAIKYGSQTSLEEFRISLSISYQNGILSIDISNTGNLNQTNDEIKDEVHGTSIKNIQKRLSIMFKDNFTFDLYEDNGWVHAVITIEYDKSIDTNVKVDKESKLIKETS